MLVSEQLKLLANYRGQGGERDHLMNVPIRRFVSMNELEFDLKNAARYIVEDPQYSLPVDFLFIPRESSRLLVGFHGAEERTKADFPKFQFVNSFIARGESLLFISDSTLLQGKKASIGWLAGNASTPLASLVSEAVSKAAAALDALETVLVGHSAGGFAAILVGTQVSNSRAISINGQTVAGRHRSWSLKNLQMDAFPECPSPAQMTMAYPERFDLRVAIEARLSTSSFTYFGHRPDGLTFVEHPHFPLLAEPFGLNETGGRTEHGDAFVPCDWESKNPNPHALPGTAIPFIQLVLGEIPSRQITHEVDPEWRW